MIRNKFNLSNYKLLTMNQGYLVPCGLLEVLPGDTFQMSTSALIRVTPLIAPVMHPVHVRIHHWFVPNRLVWDDWEEFITGGSDGFNASTFPTMAFTGTDPAVGTLADYYGVPTNCDELVSALPLRGYAKIWNENYRDQDLQTPLVIDTTDGADTTTNRALQAVAWEKDYFTSARPWTQKGPEVSIPLQGLAPLGGLTVSGNAAAAGGASFGPTSAQDEAGGVPMFPSTTLTAVGQSVGAASNTNRPQLFTDLTDVTAANINELRAAFALQRYEENRARYGSRYTEYLAFLGVRSSDARLQRPEYLGGGRQTIQFSEVLQTALNPSPATTGVGDMSGHGIGAMRSNRFRKFFEEHGFIHSFISVKPRTMYAQGLPRIWNRRTKLDYWQKEFEHVGQQEVLNKEIYEPHATPDGVFGYQDRYDEYRRQESTIAGEFRTTLDYWHMARIFSADPALNASFVAANPTVRIYQEQTAHQLWNMVNHRVIVRRQLSATGSSYIF